jgi:RNA polymerase sigma factor (sigma-70 family)
MVWGVCRRILRNHHDAEDAFQASFLVLVRKAASIRPRDMLVNWLYGVAHQTALKARATIAKRQAQEKQVTAMIEPATAAPEFAADLHRLLDAELARLPDRYRVVLVLCELEGKPLKDAAQELGVPPGTIASRLARGRAMLARRLARHGLAVSGVSLAALLAQQAGAANVPTAALASTIQAVALLASGQAASAGVISANAAALAEGVVKTMFVMKLTKLTAVALLAAACCGVGYLAHSTMAAGQTSGPEQVAAQNASPSPVSPPTAQEASKEATGQNDGKKPVALPKDKSDAVVQEGKDKEKKEEKKDEKKARKPAFTIGKETTHVVGPLDKTGRIDYETALNERLREGVTPDNNANVLLFKAIGPHPDDAKPPASFFAWMKVPAPPEKGDYFRSIYQIARARPKEDAAKLIEKFNEQIEKVMVRSWTAKDYPEVADWLKVNDKPLAVAIEASKRTHFYYPLVADRRNDKTEGLIGAQIGGVQSCRHLASALTARAMLRVSEKRYDDAWQDLLACHRLGRLLGRGGTLIESLVGIAIDRMASDADLAFLDAATLDAKKLKACLRDLRDLPPMPGMADKVDLTERFCALESVMLVDRDGVAYLNKVSGGRQQPDSAENALERLIGAWLTTDVQWDPALRNMNKIYDRMAAALRIKDRTKRNEELLHVETDIRTLKAKLLEANSLANTLFGAKSLGEAKGKFAGDVMICLLVPATIKVQQAADRAEQTQRNLHLAFALAAYKADEKRYPKTLDALAPRYLPAIPNDLFSGKALIYRPAENGYLLYSVGVNGQDDQGRGHDDDPRGDDLPVRMPLPKLRARE